MIGKWFTATASMLVLLPAMMSAQISGTQTVPGTYPSLTAAVAAINTNGIGSGGLTLNVAAGYTETLTAPLVITITSNTTTAANPLIIQKSGVGANPLLTAHAGTGTLDGMVVINGADYVTIDGIDLQENAANVTTTTQMEWGYALLKITNTNGAQNNTIKNVTVTLNKANAASAGIYLANHTSTTTTALTVSSISGNSSFNRFFNNTITNCYTGYSISGYASGAPFDFYDQGNQIGVDGVSTRRNQVTNFGGGAATANGILATNQNGLKIFKTYINSNGGATSTGTMNGISTVTGTNSNIDIYNDTIVLSCASVGGSTVVGINNSIGGSGAGNTVNIYNNVVDGCTYTTNTSGIFRGIVSSSTASYTNIYNNKVTNNSIPGTGDFAGIYYSGSSVNIVLAVNIYGNEVSGNTKTGASGNFYMIYASASAVTMNTYNNLLFNNNASTSNGAFYGYYNFAFGLGENVYNNTVYNNTGGSGDVVMLHVRSGSGPTNKEIYGNTIYNISGNTAVNFMAIWQEYGTVSNIYNNNIYNLTNNNATGTGIGGVIGINVASNFNVTTNVYNNYISELKAPVMSNVTALVGIYINSPANSVSNVYHNTVYLNGSSSGANFGTLALNCASTPAVIDVRNNILVNVCTPAGSGLTRAMGRSNTSLANSALTSGYNCLYAGVPSPSNLLYWDGVNSIQTIVALRNLVGPREQSSFSTFPPFLNIAASPYNLHLQTGAPTQCEGGGSAIAGYSTDFDGNTRNATTPDVGADEISGITTDIAGPNIQYTPLTNASVAATRTLTAFATITDPSGINNTVGTRPRIYYKRSTNANTFNTNTNATDGWKYVEASNTSSPYNFTINYSLLFGGGVVAGDIIQYFVVAQDQSAPPIVGWNMGSMSTTPTSVNLAAANFPIGGTLNQYTIVSAPLSGTINVGPTEVITSLTNAGGLFQLINSSTLSGNLTVNITGDLTAEAGTFALNQWAEEGTGNYTLTIAPSAAVVRNITGSNTTDALIRFDGADRVTVDGRFAGNGSYLRFLNTSNTTPTFSYINDAQNNTLRNSIIESGNTTSAALAGAVLFGTTTGVNGNDNNTVTFCELRDRSDISGTPLVLINIVGSSGMLTQYNNNITISNNNLHDWFVQNSASQNAINIGLGVSGTTITGNSFYQTATRTNSVSGAVTRAININCTAPVTSNGGFVITNNFIGGSAPGATGADWVVNVSGAGTTQVFNAMLVVSGLIPNSIQGNVIRKIDFTTCSPSANTTMWTGIQLGQGVHNVGTITGNVIGSGTGQDHLKITFNTGGVSSAFVAGIQLGTINGSGNIQNNTIGGITVAGNSTSPIVAQWIQIQSTPSSTTTCSNNLIGSTTTAASIRNMALTAPYLSFGIRHVINSGAGLICSGNTIQNLSDLSTAATSVSYGILAISTVGGQGTLTLSNNTIRDISTAAGSATPALLNMGIACQGMGGTTHSISGNTISGLSLSNTGFMAGYCAGIQVQGNSFGGTMSKNTINGLSNSNTGPAPGMAGVYISSGLSWTFSNNMISLNNQGNTNNLDLTGISDVMGQGATDNYYYNSIFIGGTTTGANNSYPYIRYSNPTTTLRNNLLVNSRTGGGGVHVAIGNTSATPQLGWGSGASNNNAFVVSDTTKVGVWTTTTMNMQNLRAASGNEQNSIWAPTATVTPAALFVSNSDLHINTSTYPGGMGSPVVGITTDFDNTTRNAAAPTIGADEIACPVPQLTVSSQTNPLCNGGTGSATITGTGGAGYTYSWSPIGGTAATATGLAAGTYVVNVANTCGSNNNVTVTITQPSAVTATSTQTNVLCFGAGNGVATVNVTGGTSPYTYVWTPAVSTTATATALTPGSYTCVATDANGCTTSQTFTIIGPAPLIASPASIGNVTCNGGSNGIAAVNVSGGTAPYTYNWLPTGGTGSSATGLTAGSYTCNVTDSHGCTTTQTFSITEPTALNVTTLLHVDVSCNGGTDGAAGVTVSGGTLSYTFNWAPAGGTTSMAIGVVAGTYTCTVTDGNGCTASQTFSITEPPVLVATATSQTNVSCNGGTNGDASVSVSGGTPSYTYNWLPSGGTSAAASGLSAGTYSCNVTDLNGCTTSQTFSITEPAALAVTTASQSDVLCNGDSNGSATLSVSGGNGGYTYNWSPSGGNAATATGLSVGIYTCSVTDALGCFTTHSVSITEPTVLNGVIGSVTNPTTCGGTNGSIDLTVSGGTTAYSFAWSNGPVTEDISGVPAGSYTVNITDANGCTASVTTSLSDPNAPNVTLVISNDTLCSTDAAIVLTGESPAGGVFSGTAVSSGMFDPAAAGVGLYIISYVYTDSVGCTGSTSDSIYVDICTETGTATAAASFNVYPNPNNGTFTVSVVTTSDVTILDAQGKLVYAAKMQPDQQNVVNLEADGMYLINVTDAQGQRQVKRVIVTR